MSHILFDYSILVWESLAVLMIANKVNVASNDFRIAGVSRLGSRGGGSLFIFNYSL